MTMRDARRAALAVLIWIVAAMWLAPAEAQRQQTFEFGAGDQIAIAYLESQGFTEVRILANQIFQVQAEGCKDGIRYRFIVRIDGRIFNMRQIGTCGAITEAEARRILQRAGYRRIDVSQQGHRFIAFGCKQADRYRITMSMRGEIEHERRIGTCQDQLSPGDVAAKLREQGFDRIDFIDNQLPTYVAEACLGVVKFRLEINGQGDITRETRIGRCSPPIEADDIVRIMRDHGYSQIDVIDANLPRYLAEGCKAGKRYEVSIDRFGRILGERHIGTCKRELSQREIVQILAARGFTRIDVIKADTDGYTVDACYRGRNLRMRFDIYGGFVSERDRGACVSQRVSDVLRALEDGGLRNPQLYVEGCQGNHRTRIEIDRLGDPGRRERVGGC